MSCHVVNHFLVKWRKKKYSLLFLSFSLSQQSRIFNNLRMYIVTKFTQRLTIRWHNDKNCRTDTTNSVISYKNNLTLRGANLKRPRFILKTLLRLDNTKKVRTVYKKKKKKKLKRSCLYIKVYNLYIADIYAINLAPFGSVLWFSRRPLLPSFCNFFKYSSSWSARLRRLKRNVSRIMSRTKLSRMSSVPWIISRCVRKLAKSRNKFKQWFFVMILSRLKDNR